LKYKSTGVTTSGTISFTASLLACLALAGVSRIPPNVGRLYGQARVDAEKVATKMNARSNFVILANALLLPIAIYGSMKLNEMFGSKAFSYPAEEFCHSPLFSLTKQDAVLVMGTPGDEGQKLTKRLRKEGFSAVYIDFDRRDVVEQLLQSTFFIQLMVLKIALRRKMTNCYFLENKKLLELSSSFIY
jgi:fructoselysine-6-P-deglycase FrlB-like protein